MNTYKGIKQQSNKVDSQILIKAATLAQELDKPIIADELLKSDNPILLKITSYLKM